MQCRMWFMKWIVPVLDCNWLSHIWIRCKILYSLTLTATFPQHNSNTAPKQICWKRWMRWRRENKEWRHAVINESYTKELEQVRKKAGTVKQSGLSVVFRHGVPKKIWVLILHQSPKLNSIKLSVNFMPLWKPGKVNFIGVSSYVLCGA